MQSYRFVIFDLSEDVNSFNEKLKSYTGNIEKYILIKSVCGLKKGSLGICSGDTVIFYTKRSPVTAIEISKTSKLIEKQKIEP